MAAGFLAIGFRTGAGVEPEGWLWETCDWVGGGLVFPAAALKELKVRGSRFLVVALFDGGSLRR